MSQYRQPDLDRGSSIAEKIAALSDEKRKLLEQRLQGSICTGHELIAHSLKELGITHVYSISGTPIEEILAACITRGIRVIGVRHQQAAVMMAIAQNYESGKLCAIAIVSAGPGVTNTITGVLVANDNCWPVMILGGRRPLATQDQGAFQDLNAVPIFESITKWSAVVDDPGRIQECLERGFDIACSGRPGPVYIDLPEDVLTSVSESRIRSAKNIHETQKSLDPDAIDAAASVLLRAKRPVLIVGKGMRWSNAYRELQELVEHIDMPFIASPMGRGYLPDDHPLCYNELSTQIQAQADVILVIGARLDWTFRYGSEFADDARLIRIDIHEPVRITKRMSTIDLMGNAGQILPRLLERMKQLDVGPDHPKQLRAWYRFLEPARQEIRNKLLVKMSGDSMPMSPYRMLNALRDYLPRDAICVFDGNVILAVAQQVIPSYVPASRFTPGTNGCLGVGIPFGMGAKISRPDRLVVVVTGDAAFGFNAMEMETAVRHNVPIIVLIANNDGQTGMHKQKAFYPPGHERVAAFLPGLRYDQIVSSLGGHGEYVEHPSDLGAAFVRSVESGLPSCINIQVDPFSPYPNAG